MLTRLYARCDFTDGHTQCFRVSNKSLATISASIKYRKALAEHGEVTKTMYYRY